jgi:flagellar biogenesis protein FliO
MDAQMLQTAFKMMVALGAVLLVFGASIWIARRFSASSKNFLKKGPRDGVKPLEIIAFQSLGPGRGLYLVRCLEKKILVGVTNAQVNQVLEMPDEEEEETGTEGLKSRLSQSFASTLTDKFPEQQKTSLLQGIGQSLKNISRV